MAGKIVSRVIGLFQVDVPLGSMLEAACVANMAMLVLRSSAKQADQTDVLRVLEQLESMSEGQTQ